MELDQFYTCRDVARQCVRTLKAVAGKHVDLRKAQFMEPSAGAGAFLEWLPRKRTEAMDLEPRHRDVRYGDFLDPYFGHMEEGSPPWVVVGNPPFGFAASMAVRFFNKAAWFANVIGFIVPRSFRKASVVNRLDRRFTCIHDETLPEYAFIRHGKPHDVPCAFQVWLKAPGLRPKRKVEDASFWIRYVKTQADADFALRRVGGRAGTVLSCIDYEGAPQYSPSSTYFMVDVCGYAEQALMAHDFSKVRDNTVGVRSVSKQEIAEALAEAGEWPV